MSVPRRVAVLSLHTSPLVQAGVGDSGGMNVYVRELVSSLAQAEVDSTVYVRRWHPDLDDVVDVEPGFRVVHVPAGPTDLAKEDLPAIVDEFADWVRADLARHGGTDAILANYWLSGVVGHKLKHELDVPLLTIFHTLARVKAETGDAEPARRIDAETDVIACSDLILANAADEASQLERLYHADPTRIRIVPPGVDHAYFSPGARAGARLALGLDDAPLLLFVGRIQPLKGLDVAVDALARSQHRDARLLVVGGASGAEGAAEVDRIRALVRDLDLEDRVTFHDPQPHYLLSTYYRAADVCLVPSRSESFGLVALEAAACGLPVVAAAVGGLRTLVRNGVSGYLVEGRDPVDFARHVDAIIGDDELASDLSQGAVEVAAAYTWAAMAAQVRVLLDEVEFARPVECVPR